MTSELMDHSPPAHVSHAAVLAATGIFKRFGTTQALDDVSVSFRAGEVHALMGENGAGKSTLGKVISGLHKADSGTVVVAGRTLKSGSIDDALDAGVRLIHQELAQCPNLSVAENLCLHDIPRTRLGTVDFGAMERRAMRLLGELEPGIDVGSSLGDLSPGHRQIVQIAAALDTGDEQFGRQLGPKSGPKVIVFDEPTSSLSIAEVDRLLAIVRQLAASGILCVYVSHRMSEIFAACDRVTVLRDGKFVATNVVKDIDEQTLVEQMIGRKVPPPVRKSRDGTGQSTVLEVRGLTSAALAGGGSGGGAGARGGKGGAIPLVDVSLSVSSGEILGVGGLVGAGRSELLDAIFGLNHRASGRVFCNGMELMTHGVRHLGPRRAIAAGLGYVPEDRKLQGLFFQLGVGENIVMPFMQRLARVLGVRRAGSERALVSERLKSFQVKTAGPLAVPSSLSGGNQQKLLIARWMGRETRVLLLDEPTRGIDVGTKAQIYDLVRDAAAKGLAVLLVSSEMPELLALSDRIIVLSDGRLTGELKGDDMTQANILKLATMGH